MQYSFYMRINQVATPFFCCKAQTIAYCSCSIAVLLRTHTNEELTSISLTLLYISMEFKI